MSLDAPMVAARAASPEHQQAGESGSKDTASAKEKSRSEAHENEFVVLGTVFIDPGFALPGADVRVRRAGEQKVRWRAASNGRGEFTLRIPKGTEYEVLVSAKCCAEMTHKVDARSGSRADVAFKLEPKPGAKKK